MSMTSHSSLIVLVFIRLIYFLLRQIHSSPFLMKPIPTPPSFIFWSVTIVSCLEIIYAFRPPLVSEELGCSPTLSLLFTDRSNRRGKNPKAFYFDPWNIANDANFSRMREAELKHCRVSMLAISQTMLIPILKQLIALSSSSMLDGIVYDYNNGIDFLNLLPPNGILNGISRLHASDYIQVLVTCAVLETLVFTQKDPRDMPGDYGTGYFGVRDKGAHEWQLLIELENGRLAMIALLVQLAMEFLTGGFSWDEQWGMFLVMVAGNSTE